MSTFFRTVKRAFSRSDQPVCEVTINSYADMVDATFWADVDMLRMFVPVDKICMQGGLFFANQHPFVEALHHGREVLSLFYSKVQPNSLAECYNIEPTGLLGEELPPWEMPWYKRKSRTPPPGEAGLTANHGVSFFGPVSENKIDVEMKRLVTTRNSIQKNGYKPDVYGDIQGYFIKSGEDVSFFVRGGKHRAAVLSSLGWKHIPVVFHRQLPRLIDESNADYWPLVLEKTIDCSFAKLILSRYVDGNLNRWV